METYGKLGDYLIVRIGERDYRYKSYLNGYFLDDVAPATFPHIFIIPTELEHMDAVACLGMLLEFAFFG